MLWDEENRMEYWFPKIPETIPKPKTKIIMINPHWSEDRTHMTISEEQFRTIEESSKEFSFPLFMRGSETSGKHEWKNTCFVEKFDDIKYHVTALIEDAMLKDIGCNSIVLREFIKMDSGFSAFGRDMPVNPERRYFVKGGKVLCHHPYWTQDAITQPSVENWKEILKEMNEETEGEIELLTSYAERISKEFEGYWSIDFCRSKEGRWLCIDMALGEDSWHPECPNKLTKLNEEPKEEPCLLTFEENKIPFVKERKIGNIVFSSVSNYFLSLGLSIFGIILVLITKAPIYFAILFSFQLIEDLGFDIITYYSIKLKNRKNEKKQ